MSKDKSNVNAVKIPQSQLNLVLILESSKRGRNVLAALDNEPGREIWTKLPNEEIVRHFLLSTKAPDPKNVWHLCQSLMRAGDIALMSGQEIKSLKMEMTLDQGSTTLSNLERSYEFNERIGQLIIRFHENIQVSTEDTAEFQSKIGD